MSVNWRIRYSRRDTAIWLGHLDQMRTFERSLRRAKVPVAVSGGFNPRPQIIFALPGGVGLAIAGDIIDVRLPEDTVIDQETCRNWQDRLNQSLPVGFAVRDSAIVPATGASLMSRVVAAEYTIETKGLVKALQTLKIRLNDQAWPIEKITRKGTSTVDLRPLILGLLADGTDRLRLTAAAGSRRNMRPEWLLDLLVSTGILAEDLARDARLCREALIFLPAGKSGEDVPVSTWIRGLPLD